MKARKHLNIRLPHLRIPLWWPALPGDWRAWLPSRGNVLFTLLVVAGLLWATNAGALPLRSTQYAVSSSTGTIAYQGRLADSAGTPLTGTYGMIFRLYDAASGGAPLWEEQWTGSNGVQVSDDLFNVMLGSLTPIPQSVITGHDSLYLGITVGTDDEMVPRVQLGSVPFAVHALTVPDGSVSTAKLADGAVTSAKIQDGQVASSDVGFNYAGSATKGGAANDVACSNCIAGGEIQDGQVSSNDVGFKYAGSSSKGGAASDVACSNCIASGEIQDGQVKTADLANGSVTSAKISSGAVGSIAGHFEGNARNLRFEAGNVFFSSIPAGAVLETSIDPQGSYTKAKVFGSASHYDQEADSKLVISSGNYGLWVWNASQQNLHDVTIEWFLIGY